MFRPMLLNDLQLNRVWLTFVGGGTWRPQSATFRYSFTTRCSGIEINESKGAAQERAEGIYKITQADAVNNNNAELQLGST